MEKKQNVKVRLGMFAAFMSAMFAGMFALASASSADDPVSTGFTTLQANVTTYGAAIVALVLVSAGIFLGVKYLRKGISKA